MRLRGRLVREIEGADIVALVQDEVPESAELDYKERLPGNLASERKEFAQDVAALANSRGGVLLFGIAERVEDGKKTGLPEKIVGVGDIAPDHEVRRLEQVIRDQTDPRLTGCEVRPLTLDSGETIVAVGVPRSLQAPHAVSGVYCRRAGTSRYPVPALELRRMFLERESWSQEAMSFRDARIQNARGLRTVPNLDTEGSFFLHVLPLGRLHDLIDIVARRGDLFMLSRTSNLDWKHRANIDGYILYSEQDGVCHTYAQWLRCGGVEFYSSHYHHKRREGSALDLDAAKLAFDALKYTETAVKFMRDKLAVDPPYAIALSVLDMMGGQILTKAWKTVLPFRGPEVNRFDQDELLLPEVVVDDPAPDLKATLMPVFDMIWQAAGFNDCFLRRADIDW